MVGGEDQVLDLGGAGRVQSRGRFIVQNNLGIQCGDLGRREEGLAATEEAVYTRLAEELYGSFITSSTTRRASPVCRIRQRRS